MKQLNGDIKVKQRYQAGMTLLEITVVLLILIALAGLAMPYIGGTSRKAFCDATDISMENIKRAIMDRYYLDTLGKFPQDLNGLQSATTPKYNLHYLFSKSNLDNSRTHKDFDPDSATGWRQGGYLQNGFTLSNDMTGNYANNAYGTPLKAGHIVVNDAWGRPLVLQVLNDATSDCLATWGVSAINGHCARIISAGSGSGPGLTSGDIDTKLSQLRQQDDRVLYLQQTPAGEQNPPCGDS